MVVAFIICQQQVASFALKSAYGQGGYGGVGGSGIGAASPGTQTNWIIFFRDQNAQIN